MDLGVVFGLSGMGIGLLSLAYARTQAQNAERLAETANRSATLEMQNAMIGRISDIRSQLVSNPVMAQMYLDASPTMSALYHDPEHLRAGVVLRNSIDGLQDIYFLRKRGLVDDHHWRSWTTAFVPIAGMPMMQLIFENAVERHGLEPEFETFFRPLLDGKLPLDPAPKLVK